MQKMNKNILERALNLTIVLILTLATVVRSQDFYRKVIHNTDPEAKCLDGSPGALYIHEGTQKDKFLIFMFGGGYCGQSTLNSTLQSCYQRSKTMFGSSTLWPDTISSNPAVMGFLALNDTLYRNWTKVLFAYCDGAFHQGDNANPISYKGSQLYFRGARITRSHFKWLAMNYSLRIASKIIFSGGSAGAIGAFIWGNYLQQNVESPQSVYIVPDSGIFFEFNTYKEQIPLLTMQITNLMKLAHVSEKSPLPQCNIQYEGTQWKCLFIKGAVPYLRGKYLFINSQYDSYAIENILKMDCITQNKKGQGSFDKCSKEQMTYIQSYRNLYQTALDQRIKGETRGVWSIACSNHVYSSDEGYYDVADEKAPGKLGLRVKEAIEQFVMYDKIVYAEDSLPWPGNADCAY